MVERGRGSGCRLRGGQVASLVVVAAHVVVAWCLAGVEALAHGLPDQVNNPPATTTYSCGAGGVPLAQEFTPAVAQLVAVEIFLRAGGAFPPDGLDLDLRLLAADGQELGAATVRVPGPVAAGRVVAAHFDFNSPVAVTPGARHRLAWETVVPSELSWLGADGDPYPRGDALSCAGEVIVGRDYNFITYGPAAPSPSGTPSPTMTATALPTTATPTTIPATPTPGPPEAVCPQIRGKVPDVELAAALANPFRIEGYRQLERPGQPASPFNSRRTWLTIRRLSVPYDRFWNGLVWRAGCP